MADKSPIPAAEKDDSEDVSWALSTAEAMWGRGDHIEAVKWVRRAVESASEAQDDDRALELAKAAADLATLVGPIPQTAPPPPVVAKPSAPPPPPAARPSTPPRPPPPPIRSAPPPPPPSSRPAPPAAARALPKQAAPLTSANAPRTPAAPAQPRIISTSQPRAATTAAGAKVPIPAVRPAAGVPAKASARSRRSQAKLDDEARLAAAMLAEGDPRPMPPPSHATGEVTITQGLPDEITQQIQTTPEPRRAKGSRASKPAHEEIAREVVHAPVAATTDEMDSWPTQSLVGDDFDAGNDEQTRVGELAYQAKAQMAAIDPPSFHESVRADPELRHSQAVRVVVWRGPDGVRVAPYGTTVNAIGVDALLVALDPNADLATWLSRK